MIPSHQDILVLIAVAGAVVYLAIRGWRWARGGSVGGCSGCSSCASAGAKGATPEIRNFVASSQLVMTSARIRTNRGARADGD